MEESTASGAELLVGGGYFEDTDEGHFHRPTLHGNVTSETPAVRGELSEPVLTVQTFDD